MSKTWINLLRILAGLVVLSAGVAGCMLSEATLISWWVPVCVAFTLTAVTFPLRDKWRPLTGVRNNKINAACHVLCAGCFFHALFLAGNFCFRDVEHPDTVTVEVLGKRSEIQERRRSTGRPHRYTTVRIRKYYINIVFENGRHHTLDVSGSYYNKVKGDTLELELENGAFGFPVIRQYFLMRHH